MTDKATLRRGQRWLAGVLAAPLLVLLPGAATAQSVSALQDSTCAGNRFGSALNCTAGEFTVGATFSGSPGTPAFCTAGQVFTFDASLQLSGSNTDRYDIGFFVGQQGNSPTAATAGNICSVATFPTFPLPWENNDGDACGDFNGGGVASPTVTSLKVVCAAAGGATNLEVPYVLTYQQNTAGTCSSAVDVTSASKSKCNTGTALLEVNTMPVQVGGYVDVTKQTLPDADAQSFTYTATGPVGSAVGVEINGVSSNNFGDADQNNNNTVSFSLTDGQTARVFMSVVSTGRTLTITEQPSGQPLHWESAANVSCAATSGSPTLVTSNANRQVQATLTTVNKAAACTITNTRRARISLVEQVAGRLYAADQFQLSVSGAGATSLTSSAGSAIAASAVTVTTSGTGTGAFTNPTHPSFRATPGQGLTFTTAMAAGSTSAGSAYSTTLTCTNAFAGPGATTSLPASQSTSTFSFSPAPGDDITCTYTHTAKAVLTLSKVVVNDDGLSNVASDWTLSATGPATISGTSGSGTVTNAVVPVGTYTLSESGPASYAQTGLACTGTADADPSDGLTLAAGEIATCTFTNDDQQVGQTLSKSAAQLTADPDGSGTVTEGDTLTYTVTMTNTGITTLTNVQVQDPGISPGSATCPSVSTGGTCVLVGTRVVTAGDATAGEIVNTATVTSTQLPSAYSSNTVTTPVEALPDPALEVVKSHTGNFFAGSNATYTLQASNVGYGSISGTTTVTDTLDPNLQFVSASGTGWTCGVAGSPQVVTCTSSTAIASFGDMAPITLTVYVGGATGNSVDNTAYVANTTLNGNAPVAGNTDTATVLHPDLSTSTKTVVNLGGGSTADVDAGDVLQYTINLIETAGANAAGVHVTDTVQAGLLNPTVTQLPPGATDNSSGSLVDVSGITVPANGTVQLKFQVTVGPGFSPGDPINNTAAVDNPGGADGTPAAPTLVYAQSQVVSSDDKVLYVQNGGVLNRLPHSGLDSVGTTVPGTGSADWTLSPALAADLVLTAGTIDVMLSLSTNGAAIVRVELWDGATQVGSASPTQNLSLATAQLTAFQVALAADYTVLAGRTLTLRVVNTGGGNKTVTVYAYNVGPSTVSFATSTVVRVDSVQAYADPWGGANTIPAYFVHGETAYVRVVASDPFGGADVSASDSTITVTDANGAVVAGPTTMTVVDTTGSTRTFEFEVPIAALAPLGTWTATVTAFEGTEQTINHTLAGTFEVRGRVTLDQVWGGGATAGDTVQLQVAGGSDAVAGSSTAPGPATPATATATAGASITLSQAFTTGQASGYSISLACVRDENGASIATTGTGLSRQFTMPLDTSVTCTWTDAATTPLTIVKLAIVKSDPVNGVSSPKAIPGAVVEYQLVLTNPASTQIDSGSLVVTDPVPPQVDLVVGDIAGVGSGPVRFDEGTPPSGLSYTFAGLASATDNVDFSSDNGATWTYVPTPDSAGRDPAVTDIRIRPQGAFAANNAQFSLRFRVVVQ